MTTTELLRILPFVRVAEPIRFPSGTGAGQRSSARRHLRASARVRDAAGDDGPLPLEVDEVSATGAFVLSDLLLPVGATIEIAFNLPRCEVDVVATGRVVRVEERGGRPGMGIHFDRMAGVARASLRAYTALH